MAKVRRKPPPSFPYSPRYPLPDPSDPFAPLGVLRERASSSNAGLRLTSDNSSAGNLTLDREGFFLSVNHDSYGQGLDITYPPSSTDHHETLTPPPPPLIWQERLGGYQSDNTAARPPRPPRSRVKPARESRAYFSDVEHPATFPTLLHQDQSQRQKEQPIDPQHQYRRRSKSAFFSPPHSQSQSQDQHEPPTADVPPSNASVDVLTSQHAERTPDVIQAPTPLHLDAKPDVHHARQYMYDDRQSHGYLYMQMDSGSDIPDMPTMDAQSNSRSHRSTTPPMTPDDSLSVSSFSARDRSVSLSPRSLLRDLPRTVSQPTLNAKGPIREERKDIVEQETPMTAPIHCADFPLLRPSSTPPPPEITPVPVPSSVAPIEAQPEPETEPEPEVRPNRKNAETSGKRNSLHRRIRKTSSASNARRRKISNHRQRAVVRKASTASESSLSVALAAVQALVDSPAPDTQARTSGKRIQTLSGGPSSFPSAFAQGQGATRPLQPLRKGMSSGASAEDAGADSDPGPGSRSTRFILHKPKKSLSHVSLGLSALPNISMGPTMAPSANTSIGSAMTVGAGFGSLRSLSRDDLNRHTQEFALLRPPPAAHPPVHPPAPPPVNTHPVREPEESQMATDRHVKRISSFPVLDEDSMTAEIRRDLEESSPLETSTPAFAAMARFGRPRTPVPLTPITSRAPSGVDHFQETHFQNLQREPTPPPMHSYTSPLPPIPAPIAREPSPEHHRQTYSFSPLPPPPAPEPSPEFYLSPIPISPPTELLAPAPLPMSPPQQSEPPTPLPLPTPRAKSPVPRPPSRPRDAQNPVPAVVRSDRAQEDDAPSRSRTPVERRQRKREAPREEERQSVYLPVAQLRPQAQAQVQTQPEPEPEPRPTAQTLARRRVSTAQISGPVQQPTPPVQASHRSQGRAAFLASQAPHRSQTPPADTQYRSTSSHAQHPPRAQSPPPAVPEFRAQSPPPAMPHSRVRSPPIQAAHRTQPPSTRAPSRARSPTSSQEQNTRRGRVQEQSFSQLSRAGTGQSAGTQSSSQHTHRRGTAPSTPVPQYNTPSPTMTVYSQPSPPPRTERRSRPRAVQRNGPRQQTRLDMPVANLRFDEYAIPTKEQIRNAASLLVIAQNGLRMQFGELFKDRRTVVCFLRHFWCPADQDYMYSVAREVDADALKRAGIDLIFIGLGSPAMIRSYKQIFRMSFAIYTDPTLRLHAALGMTRRTQDPGSDTERGDYLRHGPLGGLAMVVKNAIRVGMPVWEKGGDVSQLGGEFVLEPGLSCAYAHRMKTTRSHAPILHVLAAAGMRTFPIGRDGVSRSLAPPDDEDNWMEERRRSYVRMQAKRSKRREGGEPWQRQDSVDMGYGSDTGSGSVSGCWGTNMTKAETEGVQQFEEETKRPARSFHVANPDLHHYLPPTPIDEDGTDRDHGWDADVSDLPYLDGIGRTRDESYRLTQEVLAYSFGNA